AVAPNAGSRYDVSPPCDDILLVAIPARDYRHLASFILERAVPSNANWPTRRDFMSQISAGGALLAAHAALGPPTGTKNRKPDQYPKKSNASPNDDAPLIRRLRLRTAAPLDEMRRFYEAKIGLRVLGQTQQELRLAAGTTALTFVTASPAEVHGDGN